jgi:ATP-dependent DNA ligase
MFVTRSRPAKAVLRRIDDTPEKRCGTYICSMSIERLRKRLAADRASFIEPCLPSPAQSRRRGPIGFTRSSTNGFRLMARRDPVGIRLITRKGHNWSTRYPLVVEA